MNLKDRLEMIRQERGIKGVAEVLTSPLAKIAQSFGSSGLLNGESFFDRMDYKTAGLMGVQFLSDVLSKFEFPVAPQVVYRGLKQAKMADDETIKDAMAMFGVKTLTASGIQREFEIPLVIRKGEFLEPSVMTIDGAPRIICQAEIDAFLDKATFEDIFDTRGGMYTAPLEPELRDSLLKMREELGRIPHANLGMYYMGSKTAQQHYTGNQEYVIIERGEQVYNYCMRGISSEQKGNALSGIAADVSTAEMVAGSTQTVEVYDSSISAVDKYMGAPFAPHVMNYYWNEKRGKWSGSREGSKNAQSYPVGVTDEQANQIVNLWQEGNAASDISDMMDLPYDLIDAVINIYQRMMMAAQKKNATNIDGVMASINSRGFVWSIGQIDDATLKEIKKKVKSGELKKGRGRWPYYTHGTIEKTVYYRGDMTELDLENVARVGKKIAQPEVEYAGYGDSEEVIGLMEQGYSAEEIAVVTGKGSGEIYQILEQFAEQGPGGSGGFITSKDRIYSKYSQMGRGLGRGVGVGPGGLCKCLECGEEIVHKAGMDCLSMMCQVCGSVMIRTGNGLYVNEPIPSEPLPPVLPSAAPLERLMERVNPLYDAPPEPLPSGAGYTDEEWESGMGGGDSLSDEIRPEGSRKYRVSELIRRIAQEVGEEPSEDWSSYWSGPYAEWESKRPLEGATNEEVEAWWAQRPIEPGADPDALSPIPEALLRSEEGVEPPDEWGPEYPESPREIAEEPYVEEDIETDDPFELGEDDLSTEQGSKALDLILGGGMTPAEIAKEVGVGKDVIQTFWVNINKSFPEMVPEISAAEYPGGRRPPVVEPPEPVEAPELFDTPEAAPITKYEPEEPEILLQLPSDIAEFGLDRASLLPEGVSFEDVSWDTEEERIQPGASRFYTDPKTKVEIIQRLESRVGPDGNTQFYFSDPYQLETEAPPEAVAEAPEYWGEPLEVAEAPPEPFEMPVDWPTGVGEGIPEMAVPSPVKLEMLGLPPSEVIPSEGAKPAPLIEDIPEADVTMTDPETGQVVNVLPEETMDFPVAPTYYPPPDVSAYGAPVTPEIPEDVSFGLGVASPLGDAVEVGKGELLPEVKTPQVDVNLSEMVEPISVPLEIPSELTVQETGGTPPVSPNVLPAPSPEAPEILGLPVETFIEPEVPEPSVAPRRAPRRAPQVVPPEVVVPEAAPVVPQITLPVIEGPGAYVVDPETGVQEFVSGAQPTPISTPLVQVPIAGDPFQYIEREQPYIDYGSNIPEVGAPVSEAAPADYYGSPVGGEAPPPPVGVIPGAEWGGAEPPSGEEIGPQGSKQSRKESQSGVLLSEVEKLASSGANIADIVFHLMQRQATRVEIDGILNQVEEIGIL